MPQAGQIVDEFTGGWSVGEGVGGTVAAAIGAGVEDGEGLGVAVDVVIVSRVKGGEGSASFGVYTNGV